MVFSVVSFSFFDFFFTGSRLKKPGLNVRPSQVLKSHVVKQRKGYNQDPGQDDNATAYPACCSRCSWTQVCWSVPDHPPSESQHL